jgi:glutamate/tyrosine decarboxylase-like PLP-dependent enzyme
MDQDIERWNRLLVWLPARIVRWIEKRLRADPRVRGKIEAEADQLSAALEPQLKPYRGTLTRHAHLPVRGRPREEVLADLQAMHAREKTIWQSGHVSGAVYHGDAAHIDFLCRAYAVHSQSNPLHADLWPSATKCEAEIVSMTARMLGAGSGVCGTVTSGGTESIILAMKAYRDQAREERGIERADVVAPVTAHAAFDKGAELLGMRLIRTPVLADFRADVNAVSAAVTRRTVLIVGSAPTFPHGVVDPIGQLAEIARQRGIGFHIDACLGGFVLPWAERLGYPVEPFDFRLPGVTSMSADTHKYGYAAKGTSVVLYRSPQLRRHQYFTATQWPGGLYFSPTLAGSRPGGLSAACWAALVSIGEDGYLEATRRILSSAAQIKEGLRSIDQVRILGDPLWVIAFDCPDLDVYQVLDRMSAGGWNLNGLHMPPAVHLCVTLRHAEPGVAERFVEDLRRAVEHVKAHPEEKGTMAPVYGMAAGLPLRGVISDLLKTYVDRLYEV